MSPRTSLFAAAMSSLALVAAAAPAAAQETRSIEVEYSDLNLANEKGAQRLQYRIKSAARQVCGTVGSRDLAAQAAHKECVSDAIDSTRGVVVTLLAEARNPNKLARASRSLVVSN